MKKFLIIAFLFVTALTRSFAQSGDLEVIEISPSLPTINLNGTSELLLVVNNNGPQGLPVGSARVSISINTAFLNWVLPITLTDDCGNLWNVQTASPTATTTQIQIRNSSVLPFLAGCTIRIPVKGIAVGTGSVNVTSTVFGPGVSDPNGTNQGADTQIIIINPPKTVDDNASTPVRTPVDITVLANDTAGSHPIDPGSVRLIDTNGAEQTTVTIPGEGTYTVNTTTGVITFTPDFDFNGSTSTIKYVIKDVKTPLAQISNQSTITVNVGPLPVKLISFSAAKEGIIATLKWATSEETNSDHFEIQHSLSGKDWEYLGKVSSHGESKTQKTYSFNHKTPVNGENLYRLKMVDKDLTFAYSSIKSVKFEGLSTADLSIYPNPTADKLMIRDFGTVKEIMVSNLSGVTVYKSSSFANSNGGIDVTSFPQGMYIVKISRTNGVVSTSKVVVGK